ncbi:hypothetical protein PRZ48_010394 [Zasmidium cellare]|uniref:Calpain catalytic domain-containing protein n=1 Tax=Zasmidium cellare TaxID=395010 RepID=A0ABR0E941_ZASCE|nr:hypothetical protein PRZ48_010394 [Zasmidium cellare]
MKSGFYRIRERADPDPSPGPTPFPIKIVADEPAAPDTSLLDGVPLPGVKRNDEFYKPWEKFLAVEPKRAKKLSRSARATVAERKAVEKSPEGGLTVKENAARSWEEAAAQCKAKVNAIVAECERLNEKYRDRDFDLEGGPNCLQSLNGRYAADDEDPPPWVKRVEDIFDKPQFFIDGADATDVHQGSNGDCWFLAKGQELVDKLCVAKNEKVGVYGFVFHRDGEWIHEVIDDKLFLRVGDDDDLDVVRDWNPEKKQGSKIAYDDDKLKEVLQRGGTALYFGHCKSNETWLPLIEKAYAKAHGDYAAIEGGYASEGTEDLTGGVAVSLNPEDIMDKDKFWREQLLNVNKRYLFGGGSRQGDTKGFIGGHAYAVLQTWEEGDLRLLKIRNPWGDTEWEGDWSDGSKLWTPEMMTKLKHTFGDDGVFWISYKDFLKHFARINRVRLFDESWSVSQQWTCVQVPWTVDYLDTHFQFTVTEQGPVVIVLCQPDDRFYHGLGGRYIYSLHFRLYKVDDDSHYIVRSMHSSGADTVYTRSVSAEVDLEPGTYRVVFKVTAVRANAASTAEEVIFKCADSRKEKLLHVGRRFDYAQSKGNLKGMEEKLRKEKKEVKREKQLSSMKKIRGLNKQERERARLRKKRVSDAMKERRKAFEAKRREKEEARKQRAAAKGEVTGEAGSTDAQPSVESSEKGAQSATNSEELVEVNKADAESQNETKDEDPKPDTQIQPSTTQDDEPANTTTTNDAPKPETQEPKDLTNKLSTLTLNTTTAKSPISPLDPDSETDSPISPISELADDDFDWDPEIDPPLFSDSDSPPDGGSSSSSSKRKRSSNGGIFGDDPWNALCVLGLRVYSRCKDLKVRVVKEEDKEDEEEEEGGEGELDE